MEYEDISAFAVYEKIREEVQLIYRSRLQTEILLYLIESNKTLSKLREITGSTSQAVIPKNPEIRIYASSGEAKS